LITNIIKCFANVSLRYIDISILHVLIILVFQFEREMNKKCQWH